VVRKEDTLKRGKGISDTVRQAEGNDRESGRKKTRSRHVETPRCLGEEHANKPGSLKRCKRSSREKKDLVGKKKKANVTRYTEENRRGKALTNLDRNNKKPDPFYVRGKTRTVPIE